MKKYTLTLCLFIITISLSAQSFEGYVIYKMEMNNPFPGAISEEQFQEMLKQQFGEKGFGIQKIYYKGNRYFTELDAGTQTGFQLYDPAEKLLYSWQAESDTAVTVITTKYIDKVKEVSDSDEEAKILDIDCKAKLMKTSFGEMKIWYNNDFLKMEPNLYEDHVYGNFSVMLEVAGSLPLKIEMTGMAPVVLTIMEYKAEPVSDDLFKLPDFKVVIANPVN